jgi:cob(I)alamin adenosyltransferase
MVIYTRTGDKGTAATLGGERRPKTDQVFEAGGTIDELSAHLGLARTAGVPAVPGAGACASPVASVLRVVQDDLVLLGAYVSSGDPAWLERFAFGADRMEAAIDAVTASHPIDGFIVPGENELEARLHVARTVCRRAERRFHALPGRDDPRASKYINRLSDLLFALALWARRPDESLAGIALSVP